MRLSGFVIWGFERKVISKDGVVLPIGTQIPYWGHIAEPAFSILHDDQLY